MLSSGSLGRVTIDLCNFLVLQCARLMNMEPFPGLTETRKLSCLIWVTGIAQRELCLLKRHYGHT
jgi:hypothetical protein